MPNQNQTLRFKTILPGIFLFLLLSIGPSLIAWVRAPEGTNFIGALANHNDFSAYIAAMRQGGEGFWLFHFNFSPEYWAPQLMLPLYMITGKVVRPISQNYFFWFNILRAVAIVFTLSGFLFWVRQVFPGSRRYQLTAWILITFGAGLGWLFWPLLLLRDSGFTSFPDLSGAEWTALLVSFNAPHYMFGLGLEAIFFGCILGLSRATTWRWTAVGALVAFALGLVYVYHTAVVGFVVGVYMLTIAWQNRRIPWRLWLYAGITILPLLPLLFYYGYWVNRDPAWLTYVNSSPNHIPPPPLPGLIIGYGVILVLAIIAVPYWLRSKKEPLPVIWIIANLILLYIPIVQYSGRFALGLIVPMATLAAYTIEDVFLPRLPTSRVNRFLAATSPTPAASLRRIIILFVLPSTLLASLLVFKNVTTTPDFPYYVPQSEWQATSWLAEHTNKDDLVLAYYPVSNLLPAFSDTRVFAGQFFLTLHFEEKTEQVRQFWDEKTSDEWRRQFLSDWGITHIYEGKYERSIMKGQISVPGEIIYDANGIVIYEVTSD